MDIDVSLVHRLLEAQFPRWSELPVRPIESSGWDNAIYRLGTDLAVRLPRRKIAAHVEREHDWLPVLGPQLPLVTPVPLGKGVAGEGYPWHWTVCPWLTGEVAAVSPAEDMSQAAARLAGFIAALQAIDPSGGPVNQFRSGPLVTRDPVVRGAAALGRAAGTDLALAAWEAALAAPAWTGGPVWMHGDLHPANLLVEDGELTAVIDFGLLGVGDPACDLMVAWTYLPPEPRRIFRDALAVDDATWARARGWAVQLGLRAAAYSSGNPLLGMVGRLTIAEVAADYAQEI